MSITKIAVAMICLVAMGAEQAKAGIFCHRKKACTNTVPSVCYTSWAYESAVGSSDRTTLQNQINVLQQQIIDLDARLRRVGG